MRVLISSVVMSLTAIGAAAAQKPAEPVVHIGLFNYGQDGRVMGAAYENDQSALRSIVWTSRTGCQIGAGNGKPPAAATDAWDFAGQVISSSVEGAILRLDWRKTIDDGKPLAGTATSQQLTLTKGQPVVLDSITPLAPCAGTAVVFEARYDVDFIQQRIGNLPKRGGGGGGMGAATGPVSGSGGGFATGIGVGSGSGSGGGRTAGGVVSGSGSGGGLTVSSASSTSAAQTGPMYNVELWFIHTVNGREEVMAHPTMKMNREGASFSFNPIAITTAKGAPAMVQITGRLRVATSDTGEEQLQFTTFRRLTSSDRGVTPPLTVSVRDGAVQVDGSSNLAHPMPGPEEVLAFEMPPIRTRDGSVVADQFSVRLRIARQ
jgi:hypothetical protein